jgi:pseudouridine kinase
VARNVAINLASLGCRVLLCSRVGDDEAGRQVRSQPVDTSLISISERRPTASYTAVLEPDGELVLGLADMDVYEELTPSVLLPALPTLREASLWFLDANLPAATIEMAPRVGGGSSGSDRCRFRRQIPAAGAASLAHPLPVLQSRPGR